MGEGPVNSVALRPHEMGDTPVLTQSHLEFPWTAWTGPGIDWGVGWRGVGERDGALFTRLRCLYG